MTVMGDAPDDVVARLGEQRTLFPNVLVHEFAKRRYPAGPSVAHLIGYVAEISDKELAVPQFAGYQQGRWIGKGGLERRYEKWLGGEPGARYLQIDAMGRIKRWLDESLGIPPIPGRDLQLHLDLDLQRYIEGIWPRQYRGGFVAIEPQTGGILAYYSFPSFDPNQFIGGIPDTLWKRLQADPAEADARSRRRHRFGPATRFNMEAAGGRDGARRKGDHARGNDAGGLHGGHPNAGSLRALLGENRPRPLRI